MCTDFRLFILTFNEMALILLRAPIIFTLYLQQFQRYCGICTQYPLLFRLKFELFLSEQINDVGVFRQRRP